MGKADFRGQVVVVTGASSGIGRELARQLADQGARLVLAARRADRLVAVAAECRERGGQAVAVPTDVGVEAQCQALIARTVEVYGRLDMLINNAGLGLYGRLESLGDLSLFEQVLRVNLLGSVYCTYHALRHLKEARGRLVAVSSVAGRLAPPRIAAYVASKHAMAGFFDALRLELAGTGVSVTVAYPGFVVTEFAERQLRPDGTLVGAAGRAIYTPRTMSAERCARLILRAAAARRREVVMSWTGKLGLWLRLIAPGLADVLVTRMMGRRR